MKRRRWRKHTYGRQKLTSAVVKMVFQTQFYIVLFFEDSFFLLRCIQMRPLVSPACHPLPSFVKSRWGKTSYQPALTCHPHPHMPPVQGSAKYLASVANLQNPSPGVLVRRFQQWTTSVLIPRKKWRTFACVCHVDWNTRRQRANGNANVKFCLLSVRWGQESRLTPPCPFSCLDGPLQNDAEFGLQHTYTNRQDIFCWKNSVM